MIGEGPPISGWALMSNKDQNHRPLSHLLQAVVQFDGLWKFHRTGFAKNRSSLAPSADGDGVQVELWINNCSSQPIRQG